jgi:hypothetical protein
MKICIFGGGPTGMRLSDNLSKKGYNVTLYEEEEELGGIWRADWDDGYYVEYSPKLFSDKWKKFRSLLKTIDTGIPLICEMGDSKFLKYLYRHLSIIETAEFLRTLYMTNDKDKRTVETWSKASFSEKGQKCVRDLCLAVLSEEKITPLYIFTNVINELKYSRLRNFKSNDLWLKIWEEKMRSRVTFIKNTKLDSLRVEKGKVIGALTSKGEISGFDSYICAFPHRELYKIQLKSENDLLKNNWPKLKEGSDFEGFGFQLHFDSKNDDLGQICDFTEITDWNIRVLKISEYSDCFTRRNNIRGVWSCFIKDMEKINGINNKDDVVNEAIRQLSNVFGFSITPFHVTTSKGLERVDGKWTSQNSGHNKIFDVDVLNQKGKYIDNLYSVGCHNLPKMSTIETSFESADIFLEKYG